MATSRRQRLLPLALIVLLAGFGAVPLAAETLSATEHQQASIAVMRTVLGILSFVRWPKPNDSLTLCVTGEVKYFSWPSNELRQSNGPLLRMQRYPTSDSLPMNCNVLYLGKLPAASQQSLFARFLGRPTLLISEADDKCAVGHMVCLSVSKQQVNFIINLDSLSRSGVRVHPNVLKLARERP